MPGTKRGPESPDDNAVKRARTHCGGVSPVGPVGSEPHLDELGFELEEAAPVKLVNSGRRCESAWAAFETKATDLGVDLEARSEDVRQFVRVKCVRPTSLSLGARFGGITNPPLDSLGRPSGAKAPKTPHTRLRVFFAYALRVQRKARR